MKLGKIYTFENKNEAKDLIGKSVVFSDNYAGIWESDKGQLNIGKLTDIRDDYFPFKITETFQFIREIIEEEKPLMTNRQLTEWLAKGFGECTLANDYASIDFAWDYFKGEEDGLLPSDVIIRSWDSNEWVKPTLDIYERDCKGVKA